MKIYRLISAFSFILIVTSSCTVITTKNVPGKKTSVFPKEMIGTFELFYPSDLDAIMTDSIRTIVEIKEKELSTIDKDGKRTVVIGDSIFYSNIRKDHYLSLRSNKNYNVFKVVFSGNDVELYTMSPQSGVDGLEKYCKNIENLDMDGNVVPDESDFSGSFLNVTIKNSQMANYFKSDIPNKSPFILKRK